MQSTAVTVYAPSQNTGLSTVLMSLEEQFLAAARANIQDLDSYTQAEQTAMITIEALHQINTMDFAALQLRYKLIRQIRDNALFSVDPRGYQTLEQMAQDQGIAISELSDIITLNEVVFPYIEERLGASPALMWEQIGKSNFRELVPVLRSIITGERSGSNNVNGTVERLLDDAFATARAAGDDAPDPNEMRRTVVEQLLEAGQLPNRRLRERLRAEPTPTIEAEYIVIGDQVYLLAQLDEDQRTMVQRLLNGRINPQTAQMPVDRRQRQIEARRRPILSRLLQDIE